MSQENVEVVRRIYAEVNANEGEPTPDLFDPAYELDLTDVAPDLGSMTGVAASEAALREYWETFESFRVELTEVIHADERHVVTAVRDGGRVKGSHAEVWNTFFHAWTFRDGKVVRRSSHTDRHRALKAVGLEE